MKFKSVIIAATTVGLLAVSAASAQARIVDAPRNIDVVVSSTATKFNFPATSNKKVPTRSYYYADIWQVEDPFNFAGDKLSRTASFVIPGIVQSAALTPGPDNPFVIVDEADGKSRGFTMHVRRKGKLAFTSASVLGNTVAVKFKQTHYDILDNIYKPDNKTPIYLQRFDTEKQQWVNVGSPMTTDSKGVAVGRFLLPQGESALRGRRPLGVTVALTTSRTDEVCVGRRC